MKNLLFTFIFVLLAWPVLAQQQPNVLPKGKFHHSYSYLEQNQKIAISDEMHFPQPTKPNTEIAIRVDSILVLDEYGNHKEIYTYDSNGNRLTSLKQSWENGEWVNFYLNTYTYDANGYMLTSLYQNWKTLTG
ncbi:MAG: hypothetical protein K8R68_01270 [Bacteroidales bacterium]|nr:hypothetical protein [Bacteroidales bacterium]